MKKGFVFCLLMLTATFSSLRSMAQQWTFAAGFGTNTTFSETAQAIATDVAGNVYITGKFNTSINFGNGTATLTANATGTKTDGFVAKFNSSGLCQWSMKFGGAAADLGGFGITTFGPFVYVTGGSNFPSTVGALPVVTVGGSSDGIVFALDVATGTTIWAQAFGGGPAGDRGQAACTDPSGNLYISGIFFTRSTDVNQASFGAPGAFTRSVQGNFNQATSDLFVAQLNGITGTFNWVSSGGAIASGSPLTIANDNINGSGITYIPAVNVLAVTGSFVNANALYNNSFIPSSVSLTNAGGADIAVLELSAESGSFISGVATGGSTNDEGLGITTDGTNAFLTGYFNSASVAGGFSLTNTNSGTDDIFYAKYDPAANTFPWARNAGSTGGDAGLAIAAGNGGNLYVTGRYQGIATFPTNAAPLASFSAAFDDVFLLKADPSNGSSLSVSTVAGAGSGDFSFGVATSPPDNVWATGSFFGSVSFLPSSPPIVRVSSGDDDIFIARLNDPVVIPTTFYSKPAGDLHNLATWGSNPDGSGANPPDFGTGKSFRLTNRFIYALTGDWALQGDLVLPNMNELSINAFHLTVSTLSGTGYLGGTPQSNLSVINPGPGGFGNILPFGNNNKLNNLTINRPGTSTPYMVLLNMNGVEIYGVLDVQSGPFTSNFNNQIILKSTATGTARVAPVGGTIGGFVMVERYIPARRAWRILSVPLLNSQTINESWQEGTTNVSPNPNPHPGYGTHITGGPVFGSVANGFDQNPGAASSLKFYNSGIDNWSSQPNTNLTQVGGPAWMTFIRGDRSISLSNNAIPPTSTTLRAIGNIRMGDQTFTVNPTGFTAIGNPFASPIDFATITKTNVQNSVWLWDPKMGGVNGVGAYVNVSFNGTGWDVTPASVSPESQIIQSGQGFLVKTIDNTMPGQLVIKESDKSATPATDVFRSARHSTGIRINLQRVEEDRSTAILDEAFSSHTDDYDDRIDRMDVRKMSNMEENIAIVHGDNLLMVERRPNIRKEDEISLNIWNLKKGSYLLEITPERMPDSLQAWIVDRYLKSVEMVKLDQVSTVSFSITSDEASASASRFSLVFSARKPVLPDMLVTADFVRVYPNPVRSRIVQLEFNTGKGIYIAELVNSMGQVVSKTTINHMGGAASHSLKLDTKITKGMYQLRISGTGKKMSTGLLIE